MRTHLILWRRIATIAMMIAIPTNTTYELILAPDINTYTTLNDRYYIIPHISQALDIKSNRISKSYTLSSYTVDISCDVFRQVVYSVIEGMTWHRTSAMMITEFTNTTDDWIIALPAPAYGLLSDWYCAIRCVTQCL